MRIIFHENLKSLLKEQNISQTYFGNLLNVSQPTISTWCNGTREPSIKDIYKICEILKIDTNALFQWEEYTATNLNKQPTEETTLSIERMNIKHTKY